MFGGGSRRSIAIGALIGLTVLIPHGVRASSPLTLTISATPTTSFNDQYFTLTATVSPVVIGDSLPITFFNSTSHTIVGTGQTDNLGQANLRLLGVLGLFPPGTNQFYASFSGDGTFGPATSGTVDVDLIRHPTPMTLTSGTARGLGVIYTVDDLILHVRFDVAWCDGHVEIDELPGGPTWSGVAALIGNPDLTRSCGLDVHLGPQSAGTLQFSASLTNSLANEDATAGIVVPITLIDTTTTISDNNTTVELGSSTQLIGLVSAPIDGSYVDGLGTMTFFDGATNLGTVPTTSNVQGFSEGVLPVTFHTLGVHNVHVTWNGTPQASPSTSPPFALTVVPATVDASGLGLGASTFYPILDGYRDTLSIIGSLNEPASDTILIRTTAGALIGQMYIPSGPVGPYSISWNGRRSAAPVGRHAPPTSGVIVPAGTYRITQVLTDNRGIHLSVTSPVTVSWKRLYWYTGSKTLYGNQYTVKGGNGGIAITSGGAYYRGERLYDPGSTPGYYAALGYQFTLPAATSYSSISFAVLGSGTSSPYIGLQDRRLGTWPTGSPWIIDYFSPIVGVTTRYQWSTVAGDATYNRIGTTVRGMVLALDWTSGRYDVSQVRLTYRYALLK
jgi:prepilin-type processing-associated H-X9-DG protein